MNWSRLWLSSKPEDYLGNVESGVLGLIMTEVSALGAQTETLSGDESTGIAGTHSGNTITVSETQELKQSLNAEELRRRWGQAGLQNLV